MTAMANTIHSFSAGGFRSLFLLVFLLQTFLVGASPTVLAERNLVKRVKIKTPVFGQDYNGRVDKGKYLLNLLSLREEDAAEANDGVSVASPFQNPTDVTDNGWDPSFYTNEQFDFEPSYGNHLDKAFADKDFPVDPTEPLFSIYRHSRTFVQNGVEQEGSSLNSALIPPTRSVYANILFPSSGAFLFDNNLSPKENQKETGEGVVPDLNTLSDIAYFQWQAACKLVNAKPKGLKVIYKYYVVHQKSFDTITDVMRTAGIVTVPNWDDKVVFSMDEEGGQAILGTVSGSTVAWMLIQRKEDLGLKTIKEVAVFSTQRDRQKRKFDAYGKEDVMLSLRFILQDVSDN
ncbi:hypothetical protein CTA2_9559 [Colletotrichum tanaceti]|uniref:Uncharacterized protein n=1 Tax=Colletotrichum tanaceti TaxID=1306861 RepID=A0A4U6XI81_9PEZI|nr:hypothetical protein CTA2_9559 [Colletotrichum tanaceti]TKW55491.1 hypothetical protein CTA1_6915 [Colletotrichum tanaceti]